MTFFCISQGKVATSDRLGGQICKVVMSHVKFSRDLAYQKLLKLVNFWQSYSKNKNMDVLGGHGIFNLSLNLPVLHMNVSVTLMLRIHLINRWT